jgi:NAD+ diphosphatase
MPHSGARVPPLSRGTIDRAAHRRTDRQWLSAAWRDRDRARLLELAPDGSAPVADGRLVLRVPESSDPLSAAWFLGEQGRHAYFVLPVSHGQPSWRSLREVGAELSDTDAGLFSHALALVQWHASHPRCPRCGGLTEVIDAGAARRCLVDGSTHFPRTDPAVIMLVTDPSGERALL